jgi:hypothetical protein
MSAKKQVGFKLKGRKATIETKFMSPHVPELCVSCGDAVPLVVRATGVGLIDAQIYQGTIGSEKSQSGRTTTTTTRYTYQPATLEVQFKLCDPCVKVRPVSSRAARFAGWIAALISTPVFLAFILLYIYVNPIHTIMGIDDINPQNDWTAIGAFLFILSFICLATFTFWSIVRRVTEPIMFRRLPVPGVVDKLRHHVSFNEFVDISPIRHRFGGGQQSVTSSIVYDNKVVYTFSNLDYAHKFYERNKSIIHN